MTVAQPKIGLVVYTAVFGDYDAVRDPLRIQPNVRYVCFTDTPKPDLKVWDIQVQERLAPTNARAARYRKIMSHTFFPEAQFTLWLDANILYRGANVFKLVQQLLGDADMAVFKHAERDCVYEEAKAVLALKKEFPSNVHRQMQAYRKAAYPTHAGMAETGVLFRRHTPEIKTFNECWWHEIETWSHRDQLSFNYVCWKLKMKYAHIPGSARANRCPWLTYSPHG